MTSFLPTRVRYSLNAARVGHAGTLLVIPSGSSV